MCVSRRVPSSDPTLFKKSFRSPSECLYRSHIIISGGSWLVDKGRLCHMYSDGHGISSVILLSIRKNLCSLNFIVTILTFKIFVTEVLSRTIKIKMPHDIHVKNSNVGLEIYKTCLTANVSWVTTTDEIPWPWLYIYRLFPKKRRKP
jgi:hypothetical protein